MAGVTKTTNIDVTVREIDFVTRFGRTWQALRDILGIMRPIRKTPGTILKSKSAAITLESGSVSEGATIPYSTATVTETTYAEMSIEKYAKAVSVEAISAYGYDVAVAMTDDAFANELQADVMGRFYTYLNTGALTSVQTTFQMALALAKGYVLDKFKTMHRSATDVVGFVNTLDAYEYLGAAAINEQREWGFNYIQNFMGYGTIFLCGSSEIPRGTVIATPVENINLYYVDPSDSDFARAGLEYTVDGETNLIGFHAQGNYNTAVGESFAIMGMTLFAEYLDGIAVVTIEASGSLGALTASTAASTATSAVAGDAVVTISTAPVAGGLFYIKAASGTAPTAPAYLDQFDATGWTLVANGDVVNMTNGYKYTLVEVNGTGQAIATGTGTVVSKT